MSKFLGTIKHPIHKEKGYDIAVWQYPNDEIMLSWYDFSGEDYEFLTSKWAILKTNELLNRHHEYIIRGGGNGRDWVKLKQIF